MNFGVQGLANSISIGVFWSMALGVEGTFYSSVVGGRVSNVFKDFAIHEIVRICKISQTLWVDTQCDHNERNKHFEGWCIQHDNHKTCIFPHLKPWIWTPSQVKRLNLTSKNLHVGKNIVVWHCEPHCRGDPLSKIKNPIKNLCNSVCLTPTAPLQVWPHTCKA